MCDCMFRKSKSEKKNEIPKNILKCVSKRRKTVFEEIRRSFAAPSI